MVDHATTSPQPQEPNRRVHWHLEKSISIGHILTTITIAGSVLIWAMKMDSRVSVLEATAAYSLRSAEKAEIRWNDSINRLEATLIRIETKLDNKQDKGK